MFVNDKTVSIGWNLMVFQTPVFPSTQCSAIYQCLDGSTCIYIVGFHYSGCNIQGDSMVGSLIKRSDNISQWYVTLLSTLISLVSITITIKYIWTCMMGLITAMARIMKIIWHYAWYQFPTKQLPYLLLRCFIT
jgi:hypothetical protein